MVRDHVSDIEEQVLSYRVRLGLDSRHNDIRPNPAKLDQW